MFAGSVTNSSGKREPPPAGHVCEFYEHYRSNGEPLLGPCVCGRTALQMIKFLVDAVDGYRELLQRRRA